jgi:hypothetical protein
VVKSPAEAVRPATPTTAANKEIRVIFIDILSGSLVCFGRRPAAFIHVHGYAGEVQIPRRVARILSQDARDGIGDRTSRASLWLNMPYPTERATANMKSRTGGNPYNTSKSKHRRSLSSGRLFEIILRLARGCWD